jgi:serine/threonine protein kinase
VKKEENHQENLKRNTKLEKFLGKEVLGLFMLGLEGKTEKQLQSNKFAKSKVLELETVNGQKVPLELALMQAVQSVEGVVKLLDYFERSDSFIIVMERPDNCKDMFDYITEKRTVEESVARGFFKQIVETVLACHSKGVIHRDIKDENILVNTKTGQLKLIDFGTGALIKDSNTTDFEGTRIYSPPEWIRCSRYLGNIPFETDDEICNAEVIFRNHVSETCQNLIRSCLRIRPRDRIQIGQVLSHPWMRKSVPESQEASYHLIQEQLNSMSISTDSI